jgi:hypothetical protein
VPFIIKDQGTIDEFRNAIVSADAIFKQEEQQNTMLTWVLRLAGLLLMFIGLMMVVKPLSVVMDAIPLIGNIAEMGIGIVCFLIAAGFSLITVSSAWFFYRPMLSVGLIAAAVAMIVGVKMLKGKNKGTAPPSKPAPPRLPPVPPPPRQD